MSETDRNERPRWPLIWAGAALLVLLLAFFAQQRSHSGVNGAAAEAQKRALVFSKQTFDDRYRAADLAQPIEGSEYAQFSAYVSSKALEGGELARIRIWAPDRTLVFATDRRGQVGHVRARENPAIDAAFKGQSSSRLTSAHFTQGSDPTSGQELELLHTYTPIRSVDGRVVAVAEIVQVTHVLDASHPWNMLAPLLFIIGAVMAAVAVYALFRPTKVPLIGSLGGQKDEKRVANAEAEAERLRAKLVALEQKTGVSDAHTTEIRNQLAAAETRATEAEERARSVEARTSDLESELSRARSSLEVAETQREAAELDRDRARAEAKSIGGNGSSDEKVRELELALKESEFQRGLLRSGRPETVHERRVQELEAEVAYLRQRAAELGVVLDEPDALPSTNGNSGPVPEEDIPEGQRILRQLETAVGTVREDSPVDPSEMRSKLAKAWEKNRPDAKPDAKQS